MSTLPSLTADIASVQGISAVPTILETVAATTGLGFICVARVTRNSWTTCAVLDKLDFGLRVGDDLDVATTLCAEVRDTEKAVIIDCVSTDDVYCDHHTPRIYGFQSYISVPIFRSTGEYFGTLCGLDPKPANLSAPSVTSSMALFAQLISMQLTSEQHLSDTRRLLQDERETSELREQFIAVLGHDLRTPLGSIIGGIDIAKRHTSDVALLPVLDRIGRSAQRISALVDDVVDFTRGRMGGGISLDLRHEKHLDLVLDLVIEELRGLYPDRSIEAELQPNISLLCDAGRIGQLLSNLLKNALVYGDARQPVDVSAGLTNGVFRLSVTNVGPRIPEETVSQFFKPFWRGSNKSTHEGLGLGLFIVSQIAQSHRGEVSVVHTASTVTFNFIVFGPDFVERRTLPRGQAAGRMS
jgi:signal transduction histidine kinase